MKEFFETGFRQIVRRFALLTIILLIHFLAFLWFIQDSYADWHSRSLKPSKLTVSLLSAHETVSHQLRKPMIPGRPPQIAIFVTPETTPTREVEPAAPDVNAASGAKAAGAGCALAKDISHSIATDFAAMAELRALPPSIRTSADAVLLWNGQWTLPDGGSDGIDPRALRRVIEQAVAESPIECRLAMNIGPQFVQVAEENRTVMVVIGSGRWRWTDLLDPAFDAVTQSLPWVIEQGIDR